MREVVGKHEIGEAIRISIFADVVGVGGEDAVQPMVEVEHTCNAVEAKAVEMELL